MPRSRGAALAPAPGFHVSVAATERGGVSVKELDRQSVEGVGHGGYGVLTAWPKMRWVTQIFTRLSITYAGRKVVTKWESAGTKKPARGRVGWLLAFSEYHDVCYFLPDRACIREGEITIFISNTTALHGLMIVLD